MTYLSKSAKTTKEELEEGYEGIKFIDPSVEQDGFYIGVSESGSLTFSNSGWSGAGTICITDICGRSSKTTTASGGEIIDNDVKYELYREPLYIAIRGSQRLDSIFTPSVYLLTRHDEVVYVGQSINPVGRMYTHKRDKDFDGFRILKCRADRMLYWEDKLINHYKPVYNIRGWR